MPRRTVTRASCRKLPRYKCSATATQLVSGLRRHILHRDSFEHAAEFANIASQDLADRALLNRETLRRFYHALPDDLKQGSNATEAALMNWLIDYVGGRRVRPLQDRVRPGQRATA